MGVLKVQRFFQDNRENLKLTLITGETGLENLIETAEINRPGLFWAGYKKHLRFPCVVLMGEAEVDFLKDLSPPLRQERITNFLQGGPACIFLSREAAASRELIKLAVLYKVAVIKSRFTSRLVFIRLSKYLENFFSPEISVHGVLLDVYGVGTLITGKSGVGKSECALSLVRRGHRLVADDIVDIKLESGHNLMGSGAELIRHHMEIRGLGIINIRNIFGVGAIRTRKLIEMVVTLEEWVPAKEYDRLGLQEKNVTFLGVGLPEIVIPVRPGRDVATLVEVAAMNQRLKRMGSHSARELGKRLSQAISEGRATGEEE